MSRNTEFQFVSTDAAEITNFLITVYENLTGVSVRPASPEKLFAQWVASVIIQERVYNNYTANQNIPSRAEGKNLDALAELYYLQQRPQAKPAYCTERFTISEAQTFAILVPKGTRVTDASNTLIWETVADAYISAGDTYVDTAIRCQTDGTVGNGYAVGQLNVIVDVFDYYTSCTNITTSDDGSEIASDEEFYELMRESMFAFSTAGAVGSYIYHAKSVSTEIADVQAVRPAVVKKVTLDLYTKGGVKYAFWGGDTIDLSSLAVYAKGSSTAASADTDYTVTYENGLLQVAIAADGALASASQIDVSLTFDGAGHVDIYVL
ncbi:MAG: baseplate J/gp47 family protein, partial [Ruminococcus bromii]|nr:baseplate J/gp47 family protein [Ruminococcus bromii]